MKTELVQLTCPKCSEVEYRKMRQCDFMNEWVVRCKKCSYLYDANEVYKILGEVIKVRITQTIVYRDDSNTDRILEINESWM